jgi:hypothetical protein
MENVNRRNAFWGGAKVPRKKPVLLFSGSFHGFLPLAANEDFFDFREGAGAHFGGMFFDIGEAGAFVATKADFPVARRQAFAIGGDAVLFFVVDHDTVSNVIRKGTRHGVLLEYK